MKQRIKLTESALHRIVKESVKRILREGTYSPNSLPEILENMADYVNNCINNGDDVSGYYQEIVSTGLFQDSEGKTVDYNPDSYRLQTTSDY